MSITREEAIGQAHLVVADNIRARYDSIEDMFDAHQDAMSADWMKIYEDSEVNVRDVLAGRTDKMYIHYVMKDLYPELDEGTVEVGDPYDVLKGWRKDAAAFTPHHWQAAELHYNNVEKAIEEYPMLKEQMDADREERLALAITGEQNIPLSVEQTLLHNLGDHVHRIVHDDEYLNKETGSVYIEEFDNDVIVNRDKYKQFQFDYGTSRTFEFMRELVAREAKALEKDQAKELFKKHNNQALTHDSNPFEEDDKGVQLDVL